MAPSSDAPTRSGIYKVAMISSEFSISVEETFVASVASVFPCFSIFEVSLVSLPKAKKLMPEIISTISKTGTPILIPQIILFFYPTL